MSFLKKLKAELLKEAKVEKKTNPSLTKEMKIKKNFEEVAETDPNSVIQNSENLVSPDFSVKELEELKRPKEKLRKAKKAKPPENLNFYPEEKQRVKIKEEFSKSEPEIQKEKGEKKTKEEKWFEPEGQLVVDVYQTEKELVIMSAIAGVKAEDLNISGQGDIVIIKGKREIPVEDKERNYFYQECYWGPFSKEIILPVEADISRAEASMTEGVLTIRIPKIERKKEKKIIIKE